MFIRDLEFFSIAVPSPTGKSGERGMLRSLIVRLVSHTGVEGWGEAVNTALPLESLQPLRNRLLPVLMGRSVFDLEELVRLNLHASGAVRFAIETACWDMMGRICGQPIRRFLGGEYRSRIPINVPLVRNTPDELAAASQELAGRGFHWQCLTLSGRCDDDLRLVQRLLGAAHHRVELRVDAAWRYDVDSCGKLLAGLEKTGVSLLIDPLRNATPQQLATLQKRTPIPLAVHAGIDSARDVLDLAGFDSLSWLVLDPPRIGGLLELRKCADIAEAIGMHCAVISRHSTGLMTAALIQLAASLPALSHGIYCDPANLDTGILRDPFEASDELLHLTPGSGLGVEIDRAKLERFLVA